METYHRIKEVIKDRMGGKGRKGGKKHSFQKKTQPKNKKLPIIAGFFLKDYQ